MHLDSFRVTNILSINDSGDIAASRITALLGRNESGKSNLLRALQSLNPLDGFKALNPIKDFPRHRHLEECRDATPVVTTRWCLDEDEQGDLAAILPRAKEVKHVQIGRYYKAQRSAPPPPVVSSSPQAVSTSTITTATDLGSQRMESSA